MSAPQAGQSTGKSPAAAAVQRSAEVPGVASPAGMPPGSAVAPPGSAVAPPGSGPDGSGPATEGKRKVTVRGEAAAEGSVAAAATGDKHGAGAAPAADAAGKMDQAPAKPAPAVKVLVGPTAA